MSNIVKYCVYCGDDFRIAPNEQPANFKRRRTCCFDCRHDLMISENKTARKKGFVNSYLDRLKNEKT